MRNVRLPADELSPLDPQRPTGLLGHPQPDVIELDFDTGFAAFMEAEAAWHLNSQEQSACPN